MSLALQMQQAAEKRLQQAGMVQDVTENETPPADYEVAPEEYVQAERALSGPYCGCDTCVVREVLDSAFDVLRDLPPDQRALFVRELWGSELANV